MNMVSDIDDIDKTWTWKNVRSCNIAVYFHPLPWDWYIRTNTDIDVYSAEWTIQIGPLTFRFQADIGDCSTGDWRAKFGLSCHEAWDRAKEFKP